MVVGLQNAHRGVSRQDSLKPELFEAGTMKTIIGCAIGYLFSCRHRAKSRVFTIQGCTYQVCCDCDATREYSLETMSVRSTFHSDARLVDLMDKGEMETAITLFQTNYA
jgi:hypothetical protein